MPRLPLPPRPSRRHGVRILLTAVLLSLTAPPGHAADPQPYTVKLPDTGEAPLDSALHASASLIALRKKAPVGPFALVTRAREDQARLTTALGSFGYYDGTVAIRIAGHKLDDPALPDLLQAAKGSVEVAIDIQRGPEFKLRHVTLDGPKDPAARAIAEKALKLETGQPAHAIDVVAAQGRMLAALRTAGHALAKVSPPVATLELGAHALDVAFTIDAGPRVDLGPIAIDGLARVNESFVRGRLTIHQGERFDPAKIEAARQDLAQQGVFATVRARAATKLDAAGQLPITIDVVEQKRHVVGVTAAYSTDLGASAGVTFEHRNLFGNAEKLKLGAAITQLGGRASTGAGYDVTASLTKPDFLVRDQSVTVSVEGVKESLDAYSRTAALAGLTLARKLSARWTLDAGLLAQQSQVTQEGVTRDYTLLAVPVGGKYDSTGPEGLFEPTHGIKASLTVTPTESFSTGSQYVILQAAGSTYVNLGAPGRSVLALRATVASIQGASAFQVPPDQRLYAGGSATIRGYRYQSVGPQFADRKPQGGTSLGAGTVEFRQRFGQSFGAAVFVDAGEVGTSSTPFSGKLRAGAGVGARYYTPIGPIRMDFAVPLNKRSGDDAFELYIGIGEAF